MLPSVKASLAILLAPAISAFAGESLEQTYSAQGRLIATQFVSAPFPHPARAAGHKYKDKLYPASEHYSDSTVAIFIPNHLRETDHVDFVIHFHGWNNTVAGTLKGFKLIEQFVASGKNAVLVVPEGPHDAPDSFGGKLEDQDGFKKFTEELVATLEQRAVLPRNKISIGHIILSGHSGGYRVIAGILDRGGLPKNADEVWLFDALYAGTDKFLAWSDRHHGRLLNINTDQGGTKAESNAMMDLLKKRGTPFLAVEESQATSDELKTNQLVFIHTDLPHNDVVEKRKEFCLFLKTSSLEDLQKTAAP